MPQNTKQVTSARQHKVHKIKVTQMGPEMRTAVESANKTCGEVFLSYVMELCLVYLIQHLSSDLFYSICISALHFGRSAFHRSRHGAPPQTEILIEKLDRKVTRIEKDYTDNLVSTACFRVFWRSCMFISLQGLSRHK